MCVACEPVCGMSLACVCGSHISPSKLQLYAFSPAYIMVLVHHPMYVPVRLNGQDSFVIQVRFN